MTDPAVQSKNKEAIELLKMCECLDDIDDDVADLCLTLYPEDDKLFSMADIMKGVQEIKNKLAREKAVECEHALSALSAEKDEQFKTMIEKENVKQAQLGNWSAQLCLGNLLKELEAGRR